MKKEEQKSLWHWPFFHDASPLPTLCIFKQSVEWQDHDSFKKTNVSSVSVCYQPNIFLFFWYIYSTLHWSLVSEAGLYDLCSLGWDVDKCVVQRGGLEHQDKFPYGTINYIISFHILSYSAQHKPLNKKLLLNAILTLIRKEGTIWVFLGQITGRKWKIVINNLEKNRTAPCTVIWAVFLIPLNRFTVPKWSKAHIFSEMSSIWKYLVINVKMYFSSGENLIAITKWILFHSYNNRSAQSRTWLIHHEFLMRNPNARGAHTGGRSPSAPFKGLLLKSTPSMHRYGRVLTTTKCSPRPFATCRPPSPRPLPSVSLTIH